MMISDKYREDNKTLKSHFARSKMWIRGGASQLHCKKIKDCVNPLVEMPKGHWDPEKDLGKAQRRKQWMAGAKLSAKVREKVWAGMPVTSANHCAWIETHGYDATLMEAIASSAFSGEVCPLEAANRDDCFCVLGRLGHHNCRLQHLVGELP